MYDNKAIAEFCRVLGAPATKMGGIYLDKVIGNTFKKGDTLFTLYADDANRLKLAKAALLKTSILKECGRGKTKCKLIPAANPDSSRSALFFIY